MNAFFTPIEPIQKMRFTAIGETGEAAGGGESSAPFVNVLKDAISEYNSLQAEEDAVSQALALGELDDPAQMVIASMKAEAALQTTVQLTSRMVNTYKEIMQMQV